MPALPRALSLFNGEPQETLSTSVPFPRRPELWIAVSLRNAESNSAACVNSLASLANYAYGLTSFVSLVPPDGLLLEVHGSLKLFGGLETIKEKLARELKSRRLNFDMCAGPTPRAALWLARLKRTDVLEPGALTGRLGALPLEAARWPDDVRLQLKEMGVRTVGDCLRLPRDGFARRIGEIYLRELDQALGKEPDPKPRFEVPPHFRASIEFSDEITETSWLASALQSVVTTLAADLRKHQLAVQNLCMIFHHLHIPATFCRLQLIEPAHEARRLLDPLLVRLERQVLPAPVIALELDTDTPIPLRIEAQELFADHSVSRQAPVSPAELIESLRARFGIEDVYRLGLMNDHRPERRWAKLTERLLHDSRDITGPAPSTPDRPLWILPAPTPIVGNVGEMRAGEPERIESGWWDGADIQRDYYSVITPRGQRLWIYQDCVTQAWYLHGIFG